MTRALEGERYWWAARRRKIRSVGASLRRKAALRNEVAVGVTPWFAAAAPGACKALGDERWLHLVLDNLISNAIKFTHPGGRVRVRVQDKGEFVMVSVSDDGIGIPLDDREKVFERFYRAGNRSEVNAPGTGLGLAIAREVVDKHGGKIWLESELGKGTTFHFVIPASGREREAAA